MRSRQGFVFFERFFTDFMLDFIEDSAMFVGVSFLLPSSLNCIFWISRKSRS